MDIIIVLDRMGYLAGQEYDPSPDLSTYQAMVDGWRHTTKSPPTEAHMLAQWDAYLAEQAAIQYIKDREAAMRDLLPETLYLPAILEQAKADREAGKTLCVELEEAVNIYLQILIENPEPS